MSGDASDQRLAGTERSVVSAQYEDPSHLQSRVNVYAYLRPEHPLPKGTTFEDWILDHLDWTGEESALDIGCGPGGFLSPLSLRAGRVMGFDLSLGMLARARKGAAHGQAHLSAADIQALPLVSDSVDVVVAAFMLYHVPHLDRALRELSRVLQCGGTILAFTNGPGDKAEIRQAWQEAGRRIIGQTFTAPTGRTTSTLTMEQPCSVRHSMSWPSIGRGEPLSFRILDRSWRGSKAFALA
jgi:SAM-dependent methyltransferase